MEEILQKSVNSLFNFSDVSNPSTARLLINFIKRLVEDDMKSTVEAFKLIENEIDMELNMFREKKITRNQSNRSSGHSQKTYTKLSEFPRQNSNKQRNSFGQNSNKQRNSFGQNSSKHRNSFGNFNYTTTTTSSSKGDISSSYLPDSHSENEIYRKKNHLEKCNSEGKTIETDFDSSQNYLYQESDCLPDPSSAIMRNHNSFSSIEIEEETQNFNQYEETSTNSYRTNDCSNYEPQNDDDSSELRAVLASYPAFKKEFKEIVNRILERYQISNQGRDMVGPRNITNDHYDDRSMSYGLSSSTIRTHRSSISNKKNRTKIKLPLLLAFDGNKAKAQSVGYNVNDQQEVASENIRIDEESKELDVSKKCSGSSDDRIENARGGNDGTLQSDSAVLSDIATLDKDQVNMAVDLNNNYENDKNEVTVIDVEEEISKSSAVTTEKASTFDDELTVASKISSSLLNTPKTAVDSTREWTNLDEVNKLISQATPSRRVIIKKKVPEVNIRGYNKNCNEKLIFSGNKITHVKTDRKTICREYYAKGEV